MIDLPASDIDQHVLDMDVHVQPVTDINDANVLLQLHHHLDSIMATEKNHATD